MLGGVRHILENEKPGRKCPSWKQSMTASHLSSKLANNSIFLPIFGVYFKADGAQVVAEIFQVFNLRVKSDSRP